MNKLILGIFAIFISYQSIGATKTTNKGNITKLFAYDDYGSMQGKEGADIAVWFDTGITGCEHGVWLSPSAPGYKMIASFLLTAYTSKQQVRFQIYDDKVWTGSGNKLCKIDAIRFE
jgi:hypothetical protein